MMNFSIAFFKEEFLLSLARFKWAVLAAVGLTVVSLLWLWDLLPNVSDFSYGVSIYYCSVAMLLSLVARLGCEDGVMTVAKRVLVLGAHLVLLLDAIWLWHLGELSMVLGYAHVSAIVGLLLAMFFLPFMGQKDDVPSWNFALQLLKGAAISLLVGWIVTGGLLILLKSLKMLFGISYSSDWYLTIILLFAMFLPLLLWMGQIPAGAKKRSSAILPSRFLNGVVRFLFIPLLALYIVVLYVYGGKIWMAWQLPNGGVVWLISVLMLGVISLICTLYPRLREGAPLFERCVVRWMPIVILPLVFLMSVSLYRRFSDYGITTTRLYAALLNLWFYVVCVGVFLNRSRRIHWIALSFGALFLLSSALPVNFSTWGLHAIHQSLHQLWAKNPPPAQPMDQKHYDRWLNQFSEADAQEISERLMRLRYDYSEKEVAQWVKKDIWLGHRERNHPHSVEVDYEQAGVDIPLPKGYSRVRTCQLQTKTVGAQTVVFSIDERTTVEVSLHELKELSAHPTFLLVQDLSEGKGRFVFTSIRGTIDEQHDQSSFYEISGMLFTK